MITDGDKALLKAIHQVYLMATYCRCAWNLVHNIKGKNLDAHFLKEWRKLMKADLEEDEFEIKWEELRKNVDWRTITKSKVYMISGNNGLTHTYNQSSLRAIQPHPGGNERQGSYKFYAPTKVKKSEIFNYDGDWVESELK